MLMLKNKNGLLKEAIRIALYASLASTTAVPVAMAQDNEVEEVVVTGSRITRSTIEESGNLVNIDREAIDATGDLMIADILRSSPLNTYGSFSERSGSSAQSNATIDLRGLGSEKTLVLINGHRIPGTPNLGAASVNINMIPMAAVERIEMLPDASSSVYGSDAIAGVVNIIMKKNYDGLKLTVRNGERSNDDGGESGFSLVGGISNDRGNVTFAIEHDKRDAIFDGDRDYTSPWMRDLDGNGVIDIYLETDGISYYGKTVRLTDGTTGFWDQQAANGCPSTGGFVGVLGGAAWGTPDGSTNTSNSVCGFAYADVSANKAELDRTNTYIDANFEINDSTDFFLQALFSKVESFGRYAPPAAGWSDMPADYADVPWDVDALIADGSITEDYTLRGYYRWTNVGNRDNFVSDTQYDLTSGLRGDINDDISYEVYAQYNRYDSKEQGRYYLSYLGLDYVLAEEIDPFSEEGAAAMKATVGQDNFTIMSKLYGHIQWNAGDMFGAGDTLVVAGAEQFDMEYQNLYDAASEAGLIGGSAGNTSSGDRDVSALFVEVLLPVTDDVEVDAAMRYDDYSDFGSKVSPSLGATWSTTDEVTLRARWSKGFRAPALSDLYGPDTESAEYAVDYATCEATGTPADECPELQYWTLITTNPDLDAEESTNFSIGINWEFAENWTADIAYWSVDIDDLIVERSPQSLMYAEAAGINLDPATGNYLDRSGAGDYEAYVTYDNEGELGATGIDIQVDGVIDTEVGTFTPSVILSQSLSYDEQSYYRGPIQDTAGFNLQPELRMNIGLGWTNGPHAIDYLIEYTGASAEDNELQTDGTLKASSENLDTWTTMNLGYSYDAGDYGKFKVGARNLTNEDPVLSSDDKYDGDHPDLYDNTGRVIYTEYTVEF